MAIASEGVFGGRKCAAHTFETAKLVGPISESSTQPTIERSGRLVSGRITSRTPPKPRAMPARLRARNRSRPTGSAKA